MRRLCGIAAAIGAFAVALPAGAQEAPAPATGGLCTAHFSGIPAPSGGPADVGLEVAHSAVPEPSEPCP
ncbi:MAG: hypothetical protein M3312_08105 [Actinomycetota bacterium]|jgi:hypothetical protein|nr:hypothetical protein [Actinomycetota bacterium]